VVSDSFSANNPGTVRKLLEGWLEGVEFIRQQPSRAYTLMGTIKDFNMPSDLAKTMLGGVRLADYADNKAFFGTSGTQSDYTNILGMAEEMYRELRLIKRIPDVEGSVDRRYIAALDGKFSSTSTEQPIEYKAPAKGATPFATQRRAIYFDSGSANMSVDSRAVVDEIASFMRAYENTVVDIDGNTDSTGSRSLNMDLSKERADTVKDYLTKKYGFPPQRMRTAGNGPDKPIADNGTPEGRDKNRRTDIKVYANPSN
jgi:outer membrane protein OmpA-like peptidoglycan-associated protein